MPVRVVSVSVDRETFDKVKVQLVALGLIQKSVARHGVHDKHTYWSLTPTAKRT